MNEKMKLFAVLATAFLVCISSPTSPAYGNDTKPSEELPCSLLSDKGNDLVQLFHSQYRNPDGDFESVAVFSIREKASVRPIYLRLHGARFPGMMWIKPIDLDGDGRSEFVIGESDAGVSHTYTRVSIIKIVLANEPDLTIQTHFSESFEDASDITIEPSGSVGAYIMRVGPRTIMLRNGHSSGVEPSR